MNYLYGLCCEWTSSFLLFFPPQKLYPVPKIQVRSDIRYRRYEFDPISGSGDSGSIRYPMAEPLI